MKDSQRYTIHISGDIHVPFLYKHEFDSCGTWQSYVYPQPSATKTWLLTSATCDMSLIRKFALSQLQPKCTALFITSISVTPAKILSAKNGRLTSSQSAEHSYEINTETYYVFLKKHFSWFITILTAEWSRYCIFNVCHQPQIAWGQKCVLTTQNITILSQIHLIKHSTAPSDQ